MESRPDRFLVLVPAALAVLALAQSPQTRQITISIIGTNDLHGGVLAHDGRGGLALLGGYLKNLRAARAREGGAVELIDAGDMFQGTLESNLVEGASVVAAYNVLGYQAAAIGNHEFDYGPVGDAATPKTPADDPRGALKARAAEAHFPFLTANIVEKSSAKPVSWPNVRPSTLIDVSGVRIGIIGVATAEALSSTISGNVRDLEIAPLAPAIVQEAAKLRAIGATIVVVAAHAGGNCTRFDDPADLTTCAPNGEIMQVARELPAGAVDVIVAGHVHETIAHEVRGIDIIESRSGGRAFGRVDLFVNKATGRIAGRHVYPPHDIWREPEYEGAPVVPDSAVEQALAPAVRAADWLKSEPLGVTLDTPILRRPGSESALGNLFADLMLAAAPGSDAAIENSGGVRADLPAGPLTYGRFYEAMPFDNRLVTVSVTGAQLKNVFARNFEQTTVSIAIAGIIVRGRCDAGRLNIVLVRTSGRIVGDDERLAVTTLDFIATGGDRILSPLGALDSTDLDRGGRDAMVEQLRRRAGHLSESQLVDAGRPRIVYPGTRPIQCR